MDSLVGKRVSLLEGAGWVELMDIMPRPELGISPDVAVVQAARTSYAQGSKGEEKDKALIAYLVRHRHTSPFEQVEFKFHVRAPLVSFWQWVRHRTWHMNFQSGRYVEYEDDGYYIPSVWRKQSSSNKQASSGQVDDHIAFNLTEAMEIAVLNGFKAYKAALEIGVAREQARLFLPAFTLLYDAVLKVDAHNLMGFIRLRRAEEAQHEIRVYAEAIYREFFVPLMPWTAEAMEKWA